jgi:antitoxin YefM
MRTVLMAEFRDGLGEMLDRVCDDAAPLTVARANSRSVVVISLEEYESLKATAHLMRSAANARRLLSAIDEMENGKGVQRRLID